ncbi:MAG: hypothetical protein A2081_04675 [Elusimicrobia bacterium GWC2_61_19]|nr:MAG: hypothetical protein A2081_04675 [Elusimicrobia bacterium GWC2_61_19]
MAGKPLGLRLVNGFLALFGVVEHVTVDAVVKSVYAPDGKHRLGIYHRTDNTYIFQEEVFSEKLLDMSWQPARSGPEDGCATPEEALALARKTLPWLWEIPE